MVHCTVLINTACFLGWWAFNECRRGNGHCQHIIDESSDVISCLWPRMLCSWELCCMGVGQASVSHRSPGYCRISLNVIASEILERDAGVCHWLTAILFMLQPTLFRNHWDSIAWISTSNWGLTNTRSSLTLCILAKSVPALSITLSIHPFTHPSLLLPLSPFLPLTLISFFSVICLSFFMIVFVGLSVQPLCMDASVWTRWRSCFDGLCSEGHIIDLSSSLTLIQNSPF